MSSNIFFHIDVNNAFLSWEALYHLRVMKETSDLRDTYSAVGGNEATRHGIILAKSTSAKKLGVTTGEPLVHAYKKCPELIVVQPHRHYYEEQSALFIEKLYSYAPIVEQFSIDEAFCDMSGTENIYGDLIKFAHRLKKEIYEEYGFTVNIGISSNKLLAKMASDFEKPNRVHTLFPEELESKMWPLPVRDLFFVGPSTEKTLHSLGIHTIGDIAKTDPSILKSHLKKQGEIIYNFANGRSLDLFSDHNESPKGYSHSTTIAFDIDKEDDALHVLLSLSEKVCTRLRNDDVSATVISVEIKDNNFVRTSHQRSLLSPTNTTDEFYQIASQLFSELWGGKPIRLLGVSANKVTSNTDKQLNLFDMDKFEKHAKLDSAIDNIRGRFGSDAITRAAFVKPGNNKDNT